MCLKKTIKQEVESLGTVESTLKSHQGSCDLLIIQKGNGCVFWYYITLLVTLLTFKPSANLISSGSTSQSDCG